MRILIACEESQAVCIEFRKLGFEAYSCDLQECSGGHPEWHIQGDALKEAYSGKYSLMIAHPPCTYLSRAGACWMYRPVGVLNEERFSLAMDAKVLFMAFMNAPVPHIVIENPTPLKVCELPKSSQVVQPYQHGHPYSKRTLLWLKGLPALQPTNFISEYVPYLPSNCGGAKRGHKATTTGVRSQKERSKTFPGIAQAMATQWGAFLLQQQKAVAT